MDVEGRTWYCTHCKIYPDTIVEVYDAFSEVRRFSGNEDEYEVDDTNYGDVVDVECGECGRNTNHRLEEDKPINQWRGGDRTCLKSK